MLAVYPELEEVIVRPAQLSLSQNLGKSFGSWIELTHVIKYKIEKKGTRMKFGREILKTWIKPDDGMDFWQENWYSAMAADYWKWNDLTLTMKQQVTNDNLTFKLPIKSI